MYADVWDINFQPPLTKILILDHSLSSITTNLQSLAVLRDNLEGYNVTLKFQLEYPKHISNPPSG